MIVKSINMFQI